MISPSTIVIQSLVNFSTYEPSILGDGFTGARVLSILDSDDAQRFINPGQLHAALWPKLPSGTPNDFTAYPYLKVRTQAGTVTAVGLPWIVDETYELAERSKLTIVVGSASPQDQNNIRQALSAIGIQSFTIVAGAPVSTPTPPSS